MGKAVANQSSHCANVNSVTYRVVVAEKTHVVAVGNIIVVWENLFLQGDHKCQCVMRNRRGTINMYILY